MKSLRLRQMCKYLLVAFALFTGISCTRDTFDDNNNLPEVPDGMVLVPLHTNAKDYQTPVTRAVAIETISTAELPWVLVFVGSGDDAVFFEARKVVAVGNSQDPHVILTRQAQAVRLLIVANAPATFFNGTANVAFTAENLNSILAGKTITEAANNYLNSPKVTTPTLATILYDNLYLPMSEVHDELADGIDENSSIGKPTAKVDLKRIVAKVTVTSNAPGFTLTGASVAKARNYGRLYQLPGEELLPPATNADLFNYMTSGRDIVAEAVGNTTQATPIYIYESPKEDQTSVIVKGTYNGIEGFYRLVFKSKNESGNPLMDILRNKLYVFTISSVSATGYPTIDQAIAATPSNDLLNYSVAVVDPNSHDLMDNGLYYLGVSNSDLHIYSNTPETNITAVTVTTNATDAALGFGGLKYYSVSGSGISTPGGVFDAPINVSTDGITPAATEIKINTTADFTSGTIKVQLGNMVKEINVVRSGGGLEFIDAIFDPAANESVSPEYTTAVADPISASWISFALSPDGSGDVGYNYVQPDLAALRPIYVKARSNYGNGATERAPGIVYMTRKTEGRVKLYIRQAALNTAALVYTQIADSYMGAFFRATQTNERRITIPAVGNTPATVQGKWYAMVIPTPGQDWIRLDTEPFGSNGGNISSLGATAVSGTASATEPIRFRIGANSAHPSGADAAFGGNGTPRYGLVVVAYGSPLKAHSIYVRQGDVAASIMGSVKWSPYNITDPNQSTTFRTLPLHGGTMTSYPTQAGYFLQWNKLTVANPTTSTSLPGGAGSTFWSITREVCPSGYVTPSADDFETSIAQSSRVGTAFWPGAWGYYADGYFDRGTIATSVSDEPNSTVGTGATVAYQGRLFFNSATNASVFFPASGNGGSFDASINNAGSFGSFWARTILDGDPNNAYILTINFALAFANSGTSTQQYTSVRCVRQ